MIARQTTRRIATRTRPGFTLLEVLVVVAIIVILASVATFAVVSYLGTAKEDQATIQAQNIQKAAMAYYTRTSGTYPPSLEVLVVRDPTTGTPPLLEGGVGAITDPWGNPFQYEVTYDAVGAERLVVFTVTPEGKQIQWPRQ
jgi:general secretion pathway protein G